LPADPKLLLQELETLSFEGKGEEFLESRFLTPLLACLGYESHKDYEVIRHGDDGSAFKLYYPPVEKGARRVKHYNPDYVPTIRKKMFWIIEVKSPNGVTYPFEAKYLVQGLQYCIHPEIQAKYLLLTNGIHSAVYDAHGPVLLGERAESAAPPVFRRELRKATGESYRRCGLSPRRIPTSQPDLTEAPLSRTIKFAQAGAPEVLEFIETQVPAPGPREVRIKVKAIGINRAESMWRNDKYIEPVKFPAGLGYEAAGVVDAVGTDVTDFAVGDAVSTIPAFSLNQYFTYGEVIVAPVHAVVKHPESLSFVEAASVG
jgi:hypothetical protein